GRDKAVDVLWAEAGIQFDPMVVEAFVAALPTRATVAGLMALFAAPSWLFRKAAVQAKRLGVGNVTPALGALGAAALMGGFIPGAGPADGPKIAIERADDPQESDVVDLSTQTDDLEPVEDVADSKPATKPKPVAQKEKSGPDTVVLGSRLTRGARPKTTPSGTNTATPPTSPPARTGQPPRPAQPTSKPKPTPDPQDDEHVQGDPQPGRGRDCEVPKDDSKGNSKHCG
ncbi:MAG TPA: hypothetical protein VEV43_05405, partial [Actinomycetota bacterium]|nr:hypothetical protein [Actinomycetota bacterium]